MALSAKNLEAIRTAFDVINANTAEPGSKLVLKGIGTFTRKVVAARKARNPKTGEKIDVPEYTKLAFKPSKA